MARIKASLAAERESLAFNLFKTDKTVSVTEVNETLQARDGFKMNLSRIYAIRTAARDEATTTVPTKTTAVKTTKKTSRKRTKAGKRTTKKAA